MSRVPVRIMTIRPVDTSLDPAGRRLTRAEQKTSVRVTLEGLLGSGVVLSEDWETLPDEVQSQLIRCDKPEVLLALLIQHDLLTEYQASCLDRGPSFGLVLGNYRVLDHLGTGGMGSVFKAEHIRLRRLVAIKVLHTSLYQDPALCSGSPARSAPWPGCGTRTSWPPSTSARPPGLPSTCRPCITS